MLLKYNSLTSLTGAIPKLAYSMLDTKLFFSCTQKTAYQVSNENYAKCSCKVDHTLMLPCAIKICTHFFVWNSNLEADGVNYLNWPLHFLEDAALDQTCLNWLSCHQHINTNNIILFQVLLLFRSSVNYFIL